MSAERLLRTRHEKKLAELAQSLQGEERGLDESSRAIATYQQAVMATAAMLNSTSQLCSATITAEALLRWTDRMAALREQHDRHVRRQLDAEARHQAMVLRATALREQIAATLSAIAAIDARIALQQQSRAHRRNRDGND